MNVRARIGVDTGRETVRRPGPMPKPGNLVQAVQDTIWQPVYPDAVP
jgi:hypothetical protein